MATTIKAAGAADFLKLVPLMIGYTPQLSVVIVPFVGARSVGVMRFDLPPHELVESTSSTIVGLATRVSDVTAMIPIVYTDGPAIEGLGLPILHAIGEQLSRAGIEYRDGLVVASDGWVSSFDPELIVHPLSEIQTDDTHGLKPLAESVLSGTELPDVSDERGHETRDALIELRRAVDGLAHGRQTGTLDPMALATVVMLDDLPSFYELVLDWHADGNVEAYTVAAMSWCLSRPALRDIALVQWCGGVDAGDQAIEAQMQWEQGAEYPAALAMQMWGEGPQPNPERLERALEVVRLVAASVSPADSAGPLSVAAWLSWALGRSTHAAHYAELAVEVEPGHGLAEIVQSFVTAGHLPDWAFTRPAS